MQNDRGRFYIGHTDSLESRLEDHNRSRGPFGRKCPNQCLERLAGFPGSDAAVARDEHGKVNVGRDDHAAGPPSVASGVPEAAAGVSRLGAFCPAGRAD